MVDETILYGPVKEAFERLLELALEDTGQGRIAANFVMAWWNAAEHGGFDLIDLTNVDDKVADDMIWCVKFLAGRGVAVYPDAFRSRIEKVINQWRRPDE